MNRICAVIVAYNPDEGLLNNVAALQGKVQHILIVDNASDVKGKALLNGFAQADGVSIVPNNSNLGIATALNMGIKWAKDHDYNWVLTLDQDTVINSDMIVNMMSVYDKIKDRAKVGILAPIHYDRETGYQSKYLRDLEGEYSCRNIVMTSGNLIPMETFDKIGMYDDDLFIEYVDHDFCLRTRAAGLKIILVHNSMMAHSLGNMKIHHCGRVTFFSHNYAPVRQYYRARNRVILYKRHFSIRWIFQDIEFFSKDFIKILWVEENKWNKVRATFQGVLDGIKGIKGPYSGPGWN